jgi:hypothetical protein
MVRYMSGTRWSPTLVALSDPSIDIRAGLVTSYL